MTGGIKMEKMPKNVEKWLKSHTVEDLEAALWEMKGKKAEVLAEILSILYEINDDLLGTEIPEIKALA
ncbi:hypothetical protein AciM339_0036 [Aciduliprofundum sp. MAR08-339]|nr:hypothetical protein AciM339_0036 [Aciduliprofundum sp. MAR08-339]